MPSKGSENDDSKVELFAGRIYLPAATCRARRWSQPCKCDVEPLLQELRLLNELNAIQCSSDCEVPVRGDRHGAGNDARGQCRAGNRHIYWTSHLVDANVAMPRWTRNAECLFAHLRVATAELDCRREQSWFVDLALESVVTQVIEP